MKHINVVAAVIMNNDKILVTQRDYSKYDYISYKYEFPGGKIEKDETEGEALKREIKEELNLIIDVHEKLMTLHHVYPDFELTMHAYWCDYVGGDIQLNAHVQWLWLSALELPELDWAAADIPIVENLLSRGTIQ